MVTTITALSIVIPIIASILASVASLTYRLSRKFALIDTIYVSKRGLRDWRSGFQVSLMSSSSITRFSYQYLKPRIFYQKVKF